MRQECGSKSTGPTRLRITAYDTSLAMQPRGVQTSGRLRFCCHALQFRVRARINLHGTNRLTLYRSRSVFSAIAGNLPAAPAMLGNVCVWKPSPMAAHSGYLISKIFAEAGLPSGVIQFLPTYDAAGMCERVFAHKEFASLHFTGSTKVFKKLWRDIGNNIELYKSYPRIVGETGECLI